MLTLLVAMASLPAASDDLQRLEWEHLLLRREIRRKEAGRSDLEVAWGQRLRDILGARKKLRLEYDAGRMDLQKFNGEWVRLREEYRKAKGQGPDPARDGTLRKELEELRDKEKKLVARIQEAKKQGDTGGPERSEEGRVQDYIEADLAARDSEAETRKLEEDLAKAKEEERTAKEEFDAAKERNRKAVQDGVSKEEIERTQEERLDRGLEWERARKRTAELERRLAAAGDEAAALRKEADRRKAKVPARLGPGAWGRYEKHLLNTHASSIQEAKKAPVKIARPQTPQERNCGTHATAAVMDYWKGRDPSLPAPTVEELQKDAGAEAGTNVPLKDLARIAEQKHGYRAEVKGTQGVVVLGGGKDELRGWVREHVEKGNPVILAYFERPSDGYPIVPEGKGASHKQTGHAAVVQGFVNIDGREYAVVKQPWNDGDHLWDIEDLGTSWEHAYMTAVVISPAGR